MVYLRKLLSIAAINSVLAVYGSPGSANVQTWNFDKATQSFTAAEKATQGINKTAKAGKTLSLTSSDGVRMKVAGYSDTREFRGGADTIKRGKLTWASSTALGMRNKNETKDEIKGATRAEIKGYRGIDSVVTRTGDRDGDFDMLLLEFDTAVSLTALTLDGAKGGNAGKKTADISILAYTGDGSSALVKNTWAQVLGSGSGNAFDTVGNYSNVNLSYFAVNPTNVTSTKWLIGVYNPVFGAGGDAGDDGFKLTSIETTTELEREAELEPEPQEVPVPGTLMLLLAGLLALRVRRDAGAPR